MRNRPAQILDGNLAIHPLENFQDGVYGGVRAAMKGEPIATPRRPFRDLVKALKVRGVGLLDVIDRPYDLLADAVKVHHVVAKTHRHQSEILLVFLNLVRRVKSTNRVRHAHRELPVAPYLIDGVIRLRASHCCRKGR